jgi:hypothetical protein
MYILILKTYIWSWRIHTYGLKNMVSDTYVCNTYDLKNMAYRWEIQWWTVVGGQTFMDGRWWTDGIGQKEPNGRNQTNETGRMKPNKCNRTNGTGQTELDKWNRTNKTRWTKPDWQWLRRQWHCKTIHIRKFYNDGVRKTRENCFVFFFFEMEGK